MMKHYNHHSEKFDSSELWDGGQRGSLSQDEAAALLLLLGLLLVVVFLC